MTPFIFAQHYWELHWLYPILKKTKWPVLANSDETETFCIKHKIKMITKEEAYSKCNKLVVCVMHYGQQRELITDWYNQGKQVYVIQRAFDPALNVYKDFWSMDMTKFTKYLIADQFDYDLLYPIYGDKIVLTGSPRLNMAKHAGNRNLNDIYKRVGTRDFYVATVIGGMPIHDDSLPEYYLKELPKISPYKIVYKLHPDGDYQWHKDTYPDNFFWDDSRNDPWETYMLVSASKGVITPSSFLAIEATIMKRPVILVGDLHQDEYARQSQQRQRERLPRGMSSDLNNPQFTELQRQLQESYTFDIGSLDRVVREIIT